MHCLWSALAERFRKDQLSSILSVMLKLEVILHFISLVSMLNGIHKVAICDGSSLKTFQGAAHQLFVCTMIWNNLLHLAETFEAFALRDYLEKVLILAKWFSYLLRT
jgi:hypothetical protein